MPKPPTSQRGRAARVATLPPPSPSRRSVLHRSLLHRRAVLADKRAWVGKRAWADERVSSGEDQGRRSLRDAGWRPLLTSLICLLGLGVSIYLTLAHYAGYQLVCSNKGVVNCEAVTHSPESYVFGIPVAVLGLVFFVPMLALCSPWAWRSANRLVAPVRLAGAVSGIGFVFYLVYCELFEIREICLWCTSVHVLTFLLFVLVITGWDDARAPYWDRLEG